jgi:hypothetical protein
MALKLLLRNGIYYVRGTVRGTSVYETTGTSDENAAEEIRIKREAQLLEDSIHGRKATVSFAEAASSYLDSGGSPRFLGEYDERTKRWSGLIGHFGPRDLRLFFGSRERSYSLQFVDRNPKRGTSAA